MNNRQSSRRVRALLTALALGALSGCGGDSGTEIRPAVVTVEPGEALIVRAGGSLGFSAMARDESGRPASGSVTWTVADPQVATIDAVGIATGVSAGTTTVIATAGSTRGTARLEVFVPEKIAEYESGKSYWGRGNYVQYIPGELPVVFSATHGGLLVPDEIPDRSYGVTTSDRNTMELTQAIRRAFVEQTGFAPHVIISHLRRRKLDPNREIVEAAQNNPYAEQAWRELHAWIRTARAIVEERFGRGMYFDIHGHSHDIDRLELGYLLDALELDRSDALLDAPQLIARSSIRELAQGSALSFPELLRGGPSLGGLLQDEGVRSVPSPSDPSGRLGAGQVRCPARCAPVDCTIEHPGAGPRVGTLVPGAAPGRPIARGAASGRGRSFCTEPQRSLTGRRRILPRWIQHARVRLQIQRGNHQRGSDRTPFSGPPGYGGESTRIRGKAGAGHSPLHADAIRILRACRLPTSGPMTKEP